VSGIVRRRWGQCVSKPPSALAVVLRLLGAIDLLAMIAVVMPRRWMEAGHAWAGLGDLPPGPVVGYLARSSSALYALHGALIVVISFDVVRYWRLITFLAAAALVHGGVMLAIDLAEGMPRWWTLFEGPAFAASGAVVLALQRQTDAPR
jgi:hypothetical protein